MANYRLNISIITLNVNCLNIRDKTQKLSEWINKHEPAICYLQETHFKYKNLGMFNRQKYVNPWLIHVNVLQKPLQYCRVISLQLIKINGKKRDRNR